MMKRGGLYRWVGTLFGVAVVAAWGRADAGVAVTVQAEEAVCSHTDPGNGSGPLHCKGCTQIVRLGDDVFVSRMDVGKGVPLLCNTRWQLLTRESFGWPVMAEEVGYRQREVCPLGAASHGRLLLYVNDSMTPPGTQYGACNPHLLRFDVADQRGRGVKLYPEWEGEPNFTDHSYRGFAVDSEADECLMLNIDATTSAMNWCWLTVEGETRRYGRITFPVRACYPQVSLHGGAAHVLAIEDIVEPNDEWRTFKRGRRSTDWDYVFRILYYTWTPDIGSEGFAAPIEVANVDATAGHISNQDLWVGPDGAAYVLYTEQAVQSTEMRDRYFPEESTTKSLWVARIVKGAVAERRVLLAGTDHRQPACARFHATPDGRLYALVYVSGTDSEDVLLQVLPAEEAAEPVRVPLKTAFTTFCLATERAGNQRSELMDVFGFTTSTDSLCYAQLRIGEDGPEQEGASSAE